MARVAFIGVGNMGGALAKAACKSLGAGEVAISNRTYSKAERLAKELGCQAYSSNREAVQELSLIHI